jgi:hypothetical protein
MILDDAIGYPRPGQCAVIEEPIPREVIAELEAEHRRELRRLSDLAFMFLNATDNDRDGAERLLDNFIGLLFEDGVLSTWRYRILLAAIREGL